jgi:hypothetical protein
MTVIRLATNDQKLTVALGPKLASGDKNSVYLHTIFSSHWNGFVKSAVFFTSWDKTVYEVLLDNNECVIPHEVLTLSGDLYIGVRGVDPDTYAVKTSTLVKYRIEKGAPVGDATSVGPTPDVYQQILAKLNGIKDLENVGEVVARAVSDYFEENPISVGSTATIGMVELFADRWVGGENLYSQVVSISGVTENSQVDITPSVEQLVIFYEKDLTFVTENEGGVVTAYAIGQKPENDYTIQVTITEVIS